MELHAGMQVTADLRLVRPLDGGAMGSVWVGSRDSTGENVAVKFLKINALSKADVIARFHREVTVTQRIHSPHVVKVHDAGVLGDGRPFMVMELLRGESLGNRIERLKQLQPATAAMILLQAAHGIGMAHSVGVLHRDIKPDNVFLAQPQRGQLVVKIVDFGVAKDVQEQDLELTQAGASVGTIEYMSPEQMAGNKSMDHRADLWSVAVVMYKVLCGELPFQGKTAPMLCYEINRGTFKPISERGGPPALDPWFERGLSREPSGRFHTAMEMAQEFVEALATAGIRVGQAQARFAAPPAVAHPAQRHASQPPPGFAPPVQSGAYPPTYTHSVAPSPLAPEGSDAPASSTHGPRGAPPPPPRHRRKAPPPPPRPRAASLPAPVSNRTLPVSSSSPLGAFTTPPATRSLPPPPPSRSGRAGVARTVPIDMSDAPTPIAPDIDLVALAAQRSLASLPTDLRAPRQPDAVRVQAVLDEPTGVEMLPDSRPDSPPTEQAAAAEAVLPRPEPPGPTIALSDSDIIPLESLESLDRAAPPQQAGGGEKADGAAARDEPSAVPPLGAEPAGYGTGTVRIDGYLTMPPATRGAAQAQPPADARAHDDAPTTTEAPPIPALPPRSEEPHEETIKIASNAAAELRAHSDAVRAALTAADDDAAAPSPPEPTLGGADAAPIPEPEHDAETAPPAETTPPAEGNAPPRHPPPPPALADFAATAEIASTSIFEEEEDSDYHTVVWPSPTSS